MTSIFDPFKACMHVRYPILAFFSAISYTIYATPPPTLAYREL
jgi:hypothetical protein